LELHRVVAEFWITGFQAEQGTDGTVSGLCVREREVNRREREGEREREREREWELDLVQLKLPPQNCQLIVYYY